MKYIQRKNENKTEELKKKIQKKCNISELFADLLINRGFNDEKSVFEYLHPTEKLLHSPFLFSQMIPAIQLVNKTIAEKKRILIYGDYDVDGITATVIMYHVLKRMGAEVFCHLPNRFTEGYGLNYNYCDKIIQNQFGLVVTVDNGIAAHDSIRKLRNNGIDVIVTDHHEPGATLPDANFIIDQKVMSDNYPFHDICGAVVALKFGEAVFGETFRNEFIDLAGLATIADAMPLVDENRYIVAEGMRLLAMNRSVVSLNKACGNYKIERAEDLSFGVISSINACGRIVDATLPFKLLNDRNITIANAERLSEEIVAINRKRKEEQNIAVNDIKNNRIVNPADDILITVQQGVGKGVIGLVASSVVEKYNKSTISLIRSDSPQGIILSGSGRSNGNINLFESLKGFKDKLMTFGGHSEAIGISMHAEVFPEFLKFISGIKEIGRKEEPELEYDLKIENKDLNRDFAQELLMMEPTGLGNPTPVFLVDNIIFRNVAEFSGRHFRGDAIDESGALKVIGFFMKAPENGKEYKIILDVTGKLKSLQENEIDEKNRERGVDTRPLEYLGLTERKIKQFNDKEIFTINDLLQYVPRKYLDYTKPVTVREIISNNLYKQEHSIIGTVRKVGSGQKMVYADCTDEEGRLFRAGWFHQPFVANKLFVGQTYIFDGQVDSFGGNLTSIFPKYFYSNIDKGQSLIPVYKKIKGMSDEFLMSSLEMAVNSNLKSDYLEEELLKEFKLNNLNFAYHQIHFPKNQQDIEEGTHRMLFDHLFEYALNFNYQNKDVITSNNIVLEEKNSKEEFCKLLPYTLTDGQNNAIDRIIEESGSGRRVNALVQGAVSCGKTTIAIYATVLASVNGYQSVVVAPTEILAGQHYEEFQKYLDKFGKRTVLVTSSLKAREKKKIAKEIEDGDIDVIIGTHSVFNLKYNNLAMVVVDEQHKFGVKQRNSLLQLASKPHFISMSATPIPRTLCLALYGNNTEVFEIKAKPMGRKEIITKIMENDNEVNDFMYSEIQKGHQCYVVCPSIDSSDSEAMSNVVSANVAYKNIVSYFKKKKLKVSVGMINGKMKKDDINATIDEFKNRKLDIIVSTTIVEVGVNVPNATVMVIKNSERFGLASMHQLRGRVGRSSFQSYCVLQPANIDDEKSIAVASTNDGMEIAKLDAKLRGYGDMIGTEQSGHNEIIGLILENNSLYNEINNAVIKIIADTERLKTYAYLLRN